MRTYGLGIQEVMQLPLRTFWFMSGMVERLRYDEMRLQLQVANAATDGPRSEELFAELSQRAPEPIVFNAEAADVAYTTKTSELPNAKRDRAGFETLRMMARGG